MNKVITDSKVYILSVNSIAYYIGIEFTNQVLQFPKKHLRGRK